MNTILAYIAVFATMGFILYFAYEMKKFINKKV